MAKKIPPCPDPKRYIWVETKEGGFWRLRRGLDKPAERNNAVKNSGILNGRSSKAASRIVRTLRPYLRGLEMGRVTIRVNVALKKGMTYEDPFDFGRLRGFDMQPLHPFDQGVLPNITIQQSDKEPLVGLPIANYTVVRLSPLVTDFYFEMVLVYGDLNKEEPLLVDAVESQTYESEKEYEGGCQLRIMLPRKPWVALLKLNSIEGNTPAAASRHYRMKVVAAGNPTN